MQIACPKCKINIQVPPEVTQKGVSRVQCERCEFSFIIRLGEPGQTKPLKNDEPKEPLKGVKASGASTSFAGEIGTKETTFKAQETQVTIKVDPELQAESRIETERHEQLKHEQLKIEATKVSSSDPTEPELSESSPSDMDTSPIFTPPVMEGTEDAPSTIPDISEGAGLDTSVATSGGIARVSSDAHAAPMGIPLPELPEDLLQPVPGVPSAAFSASSAESLSTDHVVTISQGIQISPMAEGGGAQGGQEIYASPVANGSGFATGPNAGSGVTEMIYTPQGTFTVFGTGTQDPSMAAGEGEDPWEGMLEPTGGKKLTALGLLITVILVLSTLVFFFILHQNNWSLDLANFSGMIDRSLGREPRQQVDQLRRGLVLTPPIVEEAKLASGERVVIAKGAIKNTDTRARKFIYVRALLKDNHGRNVVSDEAPAGNMFTEEQLAQLVKSRLMANMNPAGRDGSNAKLEAGASIGFMVIITDVPESYSSSKYMVSVEISQVEFFEEL